MKTFYKRSTSVQAQRLSPFAFDGDHPNPEHIQGVTYVPQGRIAIVELLGRKLVAEIGDYIVKSQDGQMFVMKPELFHSIYAEPEPAPPLKRRRKTRTDLRG